MTNKWHDSKANFPKILRRAGLSIWYNRVLARSIIYIMLRLFKWYFMPCFQFSVFRWYFISCCHCSDYIFLMFSFIVWSFMLFFHSYYCIACYISTVQIIFYNSFLFFGWYSFMFSSLFLNCCQKSSTVYSFTSRL